MTSSNAPAAFLSYAHVDDEYDLGAITQFRKALEGQIRLHTGRGDLRIFQDRDIAWGEEWKWRLGSWLDAVTFLVPVLTPSFFASRQCRWELQRFVDRERRLNRRDLILPVYWIESPLLESPARRAKDDLAQELAARQYIDWRELRFEALPGPKTSRALAELATYVRDALDQAGPPNPSAIAIRANAARVIHRALDEVRTADPDAVRIVNLLVDAVRDSARLPESNVRILRWVCQSRLDQPPPALQESTAEPLGPDPHVDPARADTFRVATDAVIDARAEAMVSIAGDSSVARELLDALQEISALTVEAVADGLEPALGALRQEADARLDVLHADAKLNKVRVHTTISIAEQKAIQIVAQAQAQAAETLAHAEVQAQAILDNAEREADELKEISEPESAEKQPNDDGLELERKIYQILAAKPEKGLSARTIANKARVSMGDAQPLLTRLEAAGKIICSRHRTPLYYVRDQ